MEISIPHAVAKVRKNVPWMNRTIADAIRKRNTQFRTSKRTGKLAATIPFIHFGYIGHTFEYRSIDVYPQTNVNIMTTAIVLLLPQA